MTAASTLFLGDDECEVLTAVVDLIAPPAGEHPGAAALGAVVYIDRTLGAFEVDPPLIWAGGPFSGRHGGDDGFSRFESLTSHEELAWRTRIEGSLGRPEREWNGSVHGWQEIYRDGIQLLGRDFASVGPEKREDRLAATPTDFRRLLHEHVCEACYGAPEYGGNTDLLGWSAISWPGDTQPRGWTDSEVSGRE